MNFNSVQFAVFLVVVLSLYGLVLRRERWRDSLLLVASYVFYMSWNWKVAGLIASSTLLDFTVGRLLAGEERPGRRRLLLATSLTYNLGLLAIFKYLNFFLDLSRQAVSVFGFDIAVPHLDIILPVGISFYTFQTLSYTIDVYRRQIPAEPNLVKYAVFVAFFPQLVAGPIMRAADFIPQLHRPPDITEGRCASGLLLVYRGLVKKVLIADLLAALAVDRVFAVPGDFSSWDLLVALYGYAFQVYNDFSGYSDIAIGVARLMGYDLTVNFDRPYTARSIGEFWRRWHITLSNWIWNYVFNPLNTAILRRVDRFHLPTVEQEMRIAYPLAAVTTMLLCGLWHGAALNFVVWGLWHGVLLAVTRNWLKPRRRDPVWRRTVQRFVTFHLVVAGWLLFRIAHWGDFVTYVSGLARLTGGTSIRPLFYVILAGCFLVHFLPRELSERNVARLAAAPRLIQAGVYAALTVLFVGASLGAPAFIYFQF